MAFIGEILNVELNKDLNKNLNKGLIKDLNNKSNYIISEIY